MRAVGVRGFLSCGFPGALLIAALCGFCASASAAAPSGAWVRLGERQADFKVDRDRIQVGNVEGRFRQLQVTVKGAPLEMYDIVVIFGNDQQFKPAVRLSFDAKSMTRVIDLPGDARVIKYVDFYYRSVAPGAGRATVTLFGR